MPASRSSPVSPRPALARLSLVGFALVYPTPFTWLYFIVLTRPGYPHAMQQAVFLAGKALQFGLPLVWMLLVERGRPVFRRPTRGALAWGLGTGLAMALGMAAGYWLLGSNPVFAKAAGELRTKWTELGVFNRPTLLAIGLSYILFHTLLEEYYWRWFVFGRLRELISPGAAIGVSSLGFMAHHVILVATYFTWPWATLFALATATAGAIWAWLYQRSGLLYGPWLSHLLAEIAIFAVAYRLVFG